MAEQAGKVRSLAPFSVAELHQGVLAYYAQKNGWMPIYPSLSQMPVEVGDTYFMCMSCDQAEDNKQMMLRMAAEETKRLMDQLSR